MEVTLKSITPNVETTIVEIARVSSTRQDKSEKPEGLINYLIKNKHWSPFEHGFMTLEIVTSKAIGIQLLRHRSFTFQEFSQRYATVTNVESMDFRLQAETNRQSSTVSVGTISQFEDNHGFPFDYTLTAPENHTNYQKIGDWLNDVAEHMERTLILYNEALSLGVAKECARFILPMATETTLYMSGPIRSWIHLMEIRDHSHAQLEIQLIAKEMKKIFIAELPIISKALGYTE